MKLQQKVNELSTQSEDLKDDNKSLSLRVKELEKGTGTAKENGRTRQKSGRTSGNIVVTFLFFLSEIHARFLSSG